MRRDRKNLKIMRRQSANPIPVLGDMSSATSLSDRKVKALIRRFGFSPRADFSESRGSMRCSKPDAEKLKAMIEYMVLELGASFSEIARKLHMNHSTIMYHYYRRYSVDRVKNDDIGNNSVRSEQS